MLNPDGAELFQRENAVGVDVNRDARRLSTPEARALEARRDSIRPAFRDLMQAWGTSTVLIESGALPGDGEKQRLRAVNVAAILCALDAIATGGFRAAARAPTTASRRTPARRWTCSRAARASCSPARSRCAWTSR